MNKVLEDVLTARNGHYCHALELPNVTELTETIYQFMQCEGNKYTESEYNEFFNTCTIIYLPYPGEDENSDDEYSLYDADITEIIKDCYEELF